MSDVTSISAAGAGVGPAATTGAIGGPSGTGSSLPSREQGEVGSTTSTTSSSTTQSMSMTSLSSSHTSEQSSFNTKIAALVLALMEIVLGLKDKDEDDDSKKLLVGLAGLLALSGESRWSSHEYMSLELNQSSQFSQTTTTNTSSVQAGAYSRASGGATDSAPSVGGQLDVTA